ncbi:MAG: glutamine synthetase family protein, partial [Vulcanimicrobiaceae bacterium]
MHSPTANAADRKAPAKRDVLRLAKERNVRYVRLSFVDILGVSKSVTIPVAELERALEGRVTFDGGSIDGFVRGEEADMLLRPDPASLAVYPWTTGDALEAQLICDIATADGEPFEGCPRTTLRRVIDDTRDVLAGVLTGVEIEFYLFELDENGLPQAASSDVGSYFDRSENDRSEDARVDIVSALSTMGVGVASAHHEHGAGQHEIDLKDAGILATADNLVTTRTVAKHVAARHRLHATFMPKPLESLAGSGLHVYLTLRPTEATTETNGAPTRAGRLPEDLLYAIGGLLEHAPAFTAVCNPTVNSYKRFVAAWDAPIYTVWSRRSANSLVRVPPAIDGDPRIEVRSADPSSNPYLALAVLLESMAHGIRSHLLPGDPFVGSSYDLSDHERSERRIRTLPKSLR